MFFVGFCFILCVLFVLFCFALFCFVIVCYCLFCVFCLFCFVLFCVVLFCFVLFCFVCLFVCLYSEHFVQQVLYTIWMNIVYFFGKDESQWLHVFILKWTSTHCFLLRCHRFTIGIAAQGPPDSVLIQQKSPAKFWKRGLRFRTRGIPCFPSGICSLSLQDERLRAIFSFQTALRPLEWLVGCSPVEVFGGQRYPMKTKPAVSVNADVIVGVVPLTFRNHLENQLLLIWINFTPKTSHSCLKKWYTRFSRHLTFGETIPLEIGTFMYITAPKHCQDIGFHPVGP